MSFQVRQIRDDKKPSGISAKTVLHVSRMVGKPMKAVYGYLRVRMKKEQENEKRVKMLKKMMTVLVAILLAGLTVIFVIRLLMGLQILSLGNFLSLAGAEMPTDANGYTNILLLGEGDNDHEGIDLTDTIMVASIDPTVTHSVVLLSLPRDLYVLSSEKMSKGRINSLYRDYKNFLIRNGTEKGEASKEALMQLTKEIGTFINMPIHGAVKVNFSGFMEGVDAIGGVDIVVPEDIVDPEYPGPNYTYETFSIAAGPQHIDGATALKYVRTRHTTSDFSRSARQQQVISAAAKKAKEQGILKNISRLGEMLAILEKNVQSTFTVRELIGLAALGTDIQNENILSMQINDQNGLYSSYVEQGGFLYAPPREQFDGAAVFLPVSIPEFPVTWKQIQTLSEILFRKRDLLMHAPAISVLNVDAKSGMAGKIGSELYRYGFNVEKTRNYPRDLEVPTPTSFIAVRPGLTGSEDAEVKARGQQAKKIAEFLSTTLKMPIVESPNAAAFNDDIADIIVVIDKNTVYTPLQDLVPRS